MCTYTRFDTYAHTNINICVGTDIDIHSFFFHSLCRENPPSPQKGSLLLFCTGKTWYQCRWVNVCQCFAIQKKGFYV